MNKKILITIISIIVTILIGIGAVVLVKNTATDMDIDTNKNNTNVSENKESEKNEEYEEEKKEEEFSFIYDYNTIIENENKDGLEKLYNRPVDFTTYLYEGGKYYLFIANNNTFLIPLGITRYDPGQFFVLGSDSRYYLVSAGVQDYNITDLELEANNWKIVAKDTGEKIMYSAYYPINDKKYVYISFPDVFKKNIENMDEYTKNYYKVNYPYNEADIKELVNKTIEIFSLNKVEGKPLNNGASNVKMGDIELDSNTTLHMNNIEVLLWARKSGHNLITTNDANDKMMYISEYDTIKNLENDLEDGNLAKKEYKYNGRDMYILYYNNEQNSFSHGKYIGIMFEAGGVWYTFSQSGVDPSINVDEWINSMCNGKITFK